MSRQEDGTSTDTETEAERGRKETDYLNAEVNILRPSTPFMRDHLRLIWIGFVAWALVIFGPVTATYFAQETMTNATFLGFPLHYFLVAVGGPGGALLLSVVYSWRRDRLDEKYEIDHSRGSGRETTETGEATAATDGGKQEEEDATEEGGAGNR